MNTVAEALFHSSPAEVEPAAFADRTAAPDLQAERRCEKRKISFHKSGKKHCREHFPCRISDSTT
jgi:hypothetical protein